jgi:hypothetical protein
LFPGNLYYTIVEIIYISGADKSHKSSRAKNHYSSAQLEIRFARMMFYKFT